MISPEGMSAPNRYCEAWSHSLAQLLSQLSAREWSVTVAASANEFSPAARIRVVSEAMKTQQWIVFSSADLARFLGFFLGEGVQITQSLDATQSEATEELVRQWCGLAATALKNEFGDISFHVQSESSVSRQGSTAVWLLNASSDEERIQVALELDELPIGTQQAQVGDVQTAAKPIDLPRAKELFSQANLELLMDVELPVMLRFGRRQATLREILDLATGAVLELDRQIQEPVDLVLNDRVIARGEVVIVDGSYGLQVTEVASPQQRLDSL